MNRPYAAGPADPETDPEIHSTERRSRRLRFELIFASVWLALGLFLLPGLIYGVGTALLGPYGAGGEGAGLGGFYGDFFADLAVPSGSAWVIAVGPLLLINLVRALFLGMESRVAEPGAEDAAPQPSRPPDRSARPARVEPRIGSED